MFVGYFGHAEIFQTLAQHPVIERIVGRDAIRLVFMSCGLAEFPERSFGAGELTRNQRKLRISLQRIGPNCDRFILATELPKLFAFFLASENQVVAFSECAIKTGQRFRMPT